MSKISSKVTIKRFVLQFLISTAAYFVLLLPSIKLGMYGEGADVRFAAFMPICLGVLWGKPAALGIFVGNILYDYVTSDYPFAIVFCGSLVNAISALLANILYKLFCKDNDNLTIMDSHMVLKYIMCAIVCELPVAMVVATLSKTFYDLDFFYQFRISFLSNLHNALYLGLPFMIFVPALFSKGKEQNENGKIASSTFRTVILYAIVTSMLVGALIFAIMMSYEKDLEKSLWITFQVSIITNVIFILSCSIALNYFEKAVSMPLLELAQKLKKSDDEKLNEIEILNRHFDFAVSQNSELLSADQYQIYVGLSSNKNKKVYSVEKAKEIISAICLKHVSGYTSTEASGGYVGKTDNTEENVLIYTIYGATDEQIQRITREIMEQLNQEAVLVEKNNMIRYYCYAE